VLILFRREFASYFATPLALVFIVIFLALAGLFTFFLGGFYERGQADLAPFFNYHPWLYLFLMPALSMRLWAEERKSGTIELLMTLPITPWQAVIGKFLAAWAVAGLALMLTFPIWITVNFLGDPDNGAILAATRNQVIAFIVTVVACFAFLLSGFALVLNAFQGWAPQPVIDAVASLSFLTHFGSIAKGVIDIRDLLYFATVIAVWLIATAIVLDLKKAD
jgi:ABC-2 type transport system permease protein